MKYAVLAFGLATAFATGLAWGQEKDPDLEARVKAVRREVKVIDLDEAIVAVPALVERERQYEELLGKMTRTVAGSGDLKPLLEEGRTLKLQALGHLNQLLRLHRGKFVGLTEEQVWQRLRDARFSDVHYEEEWLVNILDDLEESAGVNIELDARVYKFDTVSFDFEKTSARAMLQMMGDTLLFQWVVRGDTLYVYKERHETLFGGEWIRQKKAAWRARQEAIDKAAKESEKAAAEGGAK